MNISIGKFLFDKAFESFKQISSDIDNRNKTIKKNLEGCETAIGQHWFFSTNIARMNISMLKIYIQKNFQNFETSLL